MDDTPPYIFLIPAFFLAICLTFILLNQCWAKRKIKKNEKMTHQVSIIDINDIASHSKNAHQHHKHHHSGSKHKLKSGLQKLKSLHSLSKSKQPVITMKPNASIPTQSSLILMNECRRDLPPSYGSLFESHLQTSRKTYCVSPKRFVNLFARENSQPNVHSNVNSVVHL